jgi:hypothetical protein
MNANKKDLRAGLCPMEHRHFAAIATIIRGIDDVGYRADVAQLFAAAPPNTNPKFDQKRFLAACNVGA